jgi:[ribosomal protein S5]-alanine N-acetyltransferase
LNTISFNPFPDLATKRLLLRHIESFDDSEILSLRSDERVMKFLDRPLAKNLDDARKYIKIITNGINENNTITWAISKRNEQSLIGTIGFWRIVKEHFRAEIGFLLHPDYHGKGIMQEALTKVLDYGFHSLKLHSVEANVNPNNLPSIKLLERNKFIREAYFKENYYYNGQFLDSVIYSLIGQNDNA